MTVTQTTWADAFNLLCGKLIANGTTRAVFECRLRRDLVVKVEHEHVQYVKRAS